MSGKWKWIAGLAIASLVISACAAASVSEPVGEVATGESLQQNPQEERLLVVTPTPDALPPPSNQLSDGEYRWSQLLSRDAIRPVYEPEFVAAEQAPYDDDELVIGVEINGDAKAYAIGPLNSREMVNDELGGRPILVTW